MTKYTIIQGIVVTDIGNHLQTIKEEQEKLTYQNLTQDEIDWLGYEKEELEKMYWNSLENG